MTFWPSDNCPSGILGNLLSFTEKNFQPNVCYSREDLLQPLQRSVRAVRVKDTNIQIPPGFKCGLRLFEQTGCIGSFTDPDLLETGACFPGSENPLGYELPDFLFYMWHCGPTVVI